MTQTDHNSSSNNPPSDPRQKQSNTANPNTQLYGDNRAKVQSNSTSKTGASGGRKVEDKIPKWLWIPLLPIVLLLAIYFWFDDHEIIPRRWRASGIFGLIQIVVGAVTAAFIINTFVFQSYEVVGDSMLPTLRDGDRLIINKLGKTWNSATGGDYIPKRGDIVIFDDPSGSNRQLVKRVIGVPGDRVEIENGVITVFNDENPEGFNPDESYADSLAVDTNYTVSDVVEEGRLFVAGDNRIGGASFDSRNDLGQVPIDHVIGDLILLSAPP